MKIAYGVNGIGLGHSTRAIRIIRELLSKRQDLQFNIYSSNESLEALASEFKDEERVQTTDLVSLTGYDPIEAVVRDSRNLILPTIAKGFRMRFWEFKKRLGKVEEDVKKKQIDFVISDLEAHLSNVAHYTGIPSISIYNGFYVHFIQDEIPLSKLPDQLGARWSLINLDPSYKDAIVPSFYPKPKKRIIRTYLTPPVIREDVVKAKQEKKVEQGEKILVYVAHHNDSNIIEALSRNTGQRFIYYSKDQTKYSVPSHIVKKPLSRAEFLNDLLKCRAVISTAGHQMISEALYLGKPGLYIPEGGQFEQWYNAHFVSKQGYGATCGIHNINLMALLQFGLCIYDYEKKVRSANIKDGTDEVTDIILEKLANHRKAY